ncbi:hypothetical protein ACIMRL_002803 [Enterococcus faecalis]
MQTAEIITVLLALAPVLVAFIGLLEACVKLMTTIVDARSSRSKIKKKRKKRKKK